MSSTIALNKVKVTAFPVLNPGEMKTVKESGNNYTATLYESFMGHGNQAKKIFRYMDQSYTIISDTTDSNKNSKINGIEAGIKRVRDAGYLLPSLTVRATGNNDIACQTTHTDAHARRVMVVYLSDKVYYDSPKSPGSEKMIAGGTGTSPKRGINARARGVGDQMIDLERNSRMKRQKFYEATMVHEFGHILHEFQSEAIFWSIKKLIQSTPPILYKASDDSLLKVSQYCLTNNLLEFVAEVFTGLVYGIQYPEQILVDYRFSGGAQPTV